MELSCSLIGCCHLSSITTQLPPQFVRTTGRGLLQPQALFLATVIDADSGIRFALNGVEDLRVTLFDRVFYNINLAVAEFDEVDVYSMEIRIFPAKQRVAMILIRKIF